MKFHWCLKLYYVYIFKSGFPTFIGCKEKARFALAERVPLFYR